MSLSPETARKNDAAAYTAQPDAAANTASPDASDQARQEAQQEAVRRRLQEHLDRLRTGAGEDPDAPEGSERSGGSPFPELIDHLETAVQGGKKLRPRLLLEAHRHLTEPGTTETHPAEPAGTSAAALDAACVVELLHQAFLLHDDVIDEDLTRRGRPNVYGAFTAKARGVGASDGTARAFGVASAVVGGDLLLSLAHHITARLPVPEPTRLAALDALDAAVLASAAGEQADTWLGLRAEPAGIEEVLQMLRQKTAAYSFQLPLRLAGILAGAGERRVAELARIGAQLGLIYQIRDDLLGTFGDPRRTGKSVQNDLREGKLTLLIAHARRSPLWERTSPDFGNPALDDAGTARLRETIAATGALDEVTDHLERALDEARRLIHGADLPAGLQDHLETLALFSARRDA